MLESFLPSDPMFPSFHNRALIVKKRSYDNRVLQLPKGEVSGENKERDIQITEKFEINVKSLCHGWSSAHWRRRCRSRSVSFWRPKRWWIWLIYKLFRWPTGSSSSISSEYLRDRLSELQHEQFLCLEFASCHTSRILKKLIKGTQRVKNRRSVQDMLVVPNLPPENILHCRRLILWPLGISYVTKDF